MLQDPIKTQLRAHFANLAHEVELAASLDDGAKSRELHELLHDLASLSDRISVVEHAPDARTPSFAVRRPGAPEGVRFAGIPMGHEFTSLVLAVLQVGGVAPKFAPELIEQIRGIEGEFTFETYISLSCQNCPDVVQALNAMSAINPNIRHTMIDGALFQDEVTARSIMSVPQVFVNGEMFGSGRMDAQAILAKIDTGASARAAKSLAAKQAYDVLVLGAGPAGASAAVYTARKGVRTGILAERFGGQVLDTMAIENFISVPETEGPKFAAALEAHVRHYDVDITTGQQASGLKPARERGGLHEVTLASGATLRAKSLILAPGARWRHMNVPGEDFYRNKGVAYCPHCDGPLFKGKRVAVIGGGNSGVEAAIDLAGIVSHVTLIEFADALRADEVLQTKLRSLSNVRVVTGALTQEVLGDGQRVTGLTYRERANEQEHRVELEGIFVQIGLVPNTEWLRDTLSLTERGEIEVDAHGATSVPGVFAAGDATTTPYKQIIIATGEGAKAALSAFDFLIRLPVAEPAKAAA